MSDLVREARRNAKNWADKPDSAAMWNRFADHIEQLEAALKDIVAADHCIGGDYCPHCIARAALEDKDA
jgi:hypothetical protein